jgi:hypothetical protein
MRKQQMESKPILNNPLMDGESYQQLLDKRRKAQFYIQVDKDFLDGIDLHWRQYDDKVVLYIIIREVRNFRAVAKHFQEDGAFIFVNGASNKYPTFKTQDLPIHLFNQNMLVEMLWEKLFRFVYCKDGEYGFVK